MKRDLIGAMVSVGVIAAMYAYGHPSNASDPGASSPASDVEAALTRMGPGCEGWGVGISDHAAVTGDYEPVTLEQALEAHWEYGDRPTGQVALFDGYATVTTERGNLARVLSLTELAPDLWAVSADYQCYW